MCLKGAIINCVEKNEISHFLIFYRRIIDLPWRGCASGIYATYGIYNLEAIIRKETFGFIGRLYKSYNTIVQPLGDAWNIRIHL